MTAKKTPEPPAPAPSVPSVPAPAVSEAVEPTIDVTPVPGTVVHIQPYEAAAMPELRAIIGEKSKRAVPTLVTLRVGRLDKHVLVDIPEENLAAAWRWWQLHVNMDGERFMGVVYEITRHDIPRLYRAVGTLRLDKS